MKIQFPLLIIIVLAVSLASISCEGPMGPEGPRGEQGPVGPAGTDGSMIHAGQGAPDETLGSAGDFYLDLSNGHLYGPRMADGWGEPVGLGGTEGPQGPPGEDGSQVIAGSGPPDNSQGKEGDYYLDKDNYDLYGPKTGDGWGSPINLQGPQGEQGPEGPAGTTSHSELDNLNADDHLQYLLVDGVREATDGFAVTGTFENGNIPVEGEGTRLMWYPGKAAFRAGNVDDSEWDDDNIGNYSTALGRSTTASGNYSTALGLNTTASGPYSTALGFNTTASIFSTAMGQGTTASGSNSTAMGLQTTASGIRSTAMGTSTTASGSSSTTIGRRTIAATDVSLSIGLYNDANTTEDNTLFVAGNGSNPNNRSDAFVLDFDGNLTIAGTLTESSDRRLKTDIEPLGADVLDKLAGIRPVRYRFKEDTGHPEDEQIGLIAQEVQAQFPELVSEKSDGYLSLSYSKFTAVLLKAVQEQQDEIKQLRSENDAIRERLAKLEQRPARTAELTYFTDAIRGAGSWWTFGVISVAVCCLLLCFYYTK